MMIWLCDVAEEVAWMPMVDSWGHSGVMAVTLLSVQKGVHF